MRGGTSRGCCAGSGHPPSQPPSRASPLAALHMGVQGRCLFKGKTNKHFQKEFENYTLNSLIEFDLSSC